MNIMYAFIRGECKSMNLVIRKNKFLKNLAVGMFSLSLLLTGCSTPSKDVESDTSSPSVSEVQDGDYELEEVVVLSRHNVRAPLSTKGSDLYKMTTHEWIDWSSEASELSMRGGSLENEMGQYFRKYIQDKGLIQENDQPSSDAVRIYANSMQRTIATAQYFSSGLLPLADLKVEYHNEIGTMDPVFNPQLTFVSDSFKEQALQEIGEMGGKDGLDGIEKNLEDNYKLLADVLDLKDSEYAKENDYESFPLDDLELKFELNKEPALSGSLKKATSAADALVLQYYEGQDAKKAAFGKDLSQEDWGKISKIKDVYGDVLFTAPTVAKTIANPLLKEIKSELSNSNRKFSFLCGHDSNIGSVLAALDVETNELPNAIEKKTPIGSKVVMEKWKNNEGKEFVTLKMVYLSVDQLRNLQVIDLENPPMVYDLSLKGLSKNDDGMYKLEDVMQRFDDSISSYDTIVETYK